MKYLMLVCVDQDVKLEPEQAAGMPAATEAWVSEMDARGVRLEGHVLAPPSAGATVRVRGGEVLITDGPFTEAKELIAGFDILECASLSEALEVARRHPVAAFGALEVRPFEDS
jgi:hypothetical protein